MNIGYRKATIIDALQLAQLSWDFQLVGREDLKDTKEEFLKASEKFFEESINLGDWIHFVAEIDNQIVSTVSLKVVKSFPLPGMLKNHWGYLTNVYTKPDFRKKGISTKLINDTLAWSDSHGIKKVILWPRPAAINIYKKFGFSQESEIMEYRKE